MTTTLTAAVVHEFGSDLAVEEYTLPEPGRGQALVKLISSGVCHTDLQIGRAHVLNSSHTTVSRMPSSA